MNRSLLTFLVVAWLPATLAAAAPRRTVAIAPLSTTSTAEYQWIGPGLSQAAIAALLDQPELNTLTLRQVNAAMKDDNLQAESLSNDEVAFRLGRQLGADLLLVGSYDATWPEIRLVLKLLAPLQGKVLDTRELQGELNGLNELEKVLAAVLAKALGQPSPKSLPPVRPVRAWRDTTLALDILNWQSLSPRAADPNVPLNLPHTAVRQARAMLERVVQADAGNAEAWAGLGIAQALLDETAAAEQSLNQALTLAGDLHPNAVLGLFFLRLRQGRIDDGAAVLRKALARGPGFLHARGYLGELYNHYGRHREALPIFAEYHALAPHNPWVLTQLGYTKSKLKDHVGAISDTIAAVDLLPDSPALLIQLASRYIDANKMAGAEETLLHAVELFPQEARIYVRLGYVYLRQDKLDLAVPISEKALALAQFEDRRRDRGYAHLNLARAHGRLGDYTKAFAHLDQARQNGISSLAEVKTDPALAKLRADPRWQAGGYDN